MCKLISQIEYLVVDKIKTVVDKQYKLSAKIWNMKKAPKPKDEIFNDLRIRENK